MDTWQLVAEHMPSKRMGELAAQYPCIIAHRKDPMLDSMTVVYVQGTRVDAEKVQFSIHASNGGASCTIELMPEGWEFEG